MVFETTENQNQIFKDKNVFSKKYVPKAKLHRDIEIKIIESCLSYILQGSVPVSLTIYGIRGTGKTLISRYVTEELCKISTDVKVFYISLKNAKTEFKALGEISKEIGGKRIIGTSFNETFRTIFDVIKTLPEKYIIFIMDEINEVEKPDGLLYFLLRTNEVCRDKELDKKEIAYIFITNDLQFPQNISSGTASSFTGVSKCTFMPYNASQLRDILLERANGGLRPGVFDESIIGLCAAFSAQERGDAREAIMLLEKSGEVALKNCNVKITEDDVRQARHLVEYESTISVLRSMTTQLKAIALACVRDHKHVLKEPGYISMTGTVYTEYKNVCRRIGIEVLSQRRVTDLLAELKTIGFIEANLIYLGSRGRTKHVDLLIPVEVAEKMIYEDSHFDPIRPELVQSKL